MKNPNSPMIRLKRGLLTRWCGEDYPGGEARFQLSLLAKDIAIFLLLPIFSIFLFQAASSPRQVKRKPETISRLRDTQRDVSKSQIIDFRRPGSGGGSDGNFSKKSPGSLIRVRLLNDVETYSTAPVHALVLDEGLGTRLMGGTLIGDAVPDSNFERINISFRFARDPNRDGVAASVTARALSLDGTLGLEAHKKEGIVARSAIASAKSTSQDLPSKTNPTELKDILFRALTAGLVQEYGSDATVAKNRAEVLSLTPSTEFFAELTDYFPSNVR